MTTTPMPASASRHTGSRTTGREFLRPDCGDCFALCCTAFGFTRSADFAIDKAAGSPCPNLASDFSCSIHDRLRPRGFRGCTVFDCFGAGQLVSQGLFGGTNWREDPGSQQEMFAAFGIVRQLHEMLWYLAEAKERTLDPETGQDVQELAGSIRALTLGSVSALLSSDVEGIHATVRDILIGTSDEVRAPFLAGGMEHLIPSIRPGAELAGANLTSRRLCGADLRGACLIAADLRGSDLTAVDLLGADLRDARLDGADLSRALFVTQPQLHSARGDAQTRLPPGLSSPSHWHPA